MLTIKLEIIPNSLSSFYITNVDDIKNYKMHNLMTINELAEDINVSERILQIILNKKGSEWNGNYPRIGINAVKKSNKDKVNFIIGDKNEK